jgi:hypothetical protein
MSPELALTAIRYGAPARQRDPHPARARRPEFLLEIEANAAV